MAILRRAASGAAAALLLGAAASAAGSYGRVESLDFRLKRPDAEGRVRGSVKAQGKARAATRIFNPVIDRMCVMVGSAGVLRLGEVEGTIRGRVNAAGRWVVRASRPYGPGTSARITFTPESGEFAFTAKGVDCTRLANDYDDGAERFVFWAGPVYHGEDLALSSSGASRLHYQDVIEYGENRNPSYSAPYVPLPSGFEEFEPTTEWTPIDLGDPSNFRW
jgi:hypothetical protein